MANFDGGIIQRNRPVGVREVCGKSTAPCGSRNVVEIRMRFKGQIDNAIHITLPINIASTQDDAIDGDQWEGRGNGAKTALPASAAMHLVRRGKQQKDGEQDRAGQ